jgi:hypothetical protein
VGSAKRPRGTSITVVIFVAVTCIRSHRFSTRLHRNREIIRSFARRFFEQSRENADSALDTGGEKAVERERPHRMTPSRDARPFMIEGVRRQQWPPEQQPRPAYIAERRSAEPSCSSPSSPCSGSREQVRERTHCWGRVAGWGRPTDSPASAARWAPQLLCACGVMTRECGFDVSAHKWDITREHSRCTHRR